MGALVEPGPGVAAPVGQGLATVAEVPEVLEPLTVVEVPVPLTVELVLVDGVVDEAVELPIEPLVPGVEVEVLELPIVVPLVELPIVVPLELPIVVPLFEGVHGAVVALIPVWPVVVP